ncbi:MAG: SPFH domain-containing protein [Rhodospirillaceae bacterium]
MNLLATNILSGTAVIIGLVLLSSMFKIVNQFERVVVLTLGRYTSTRDPGLIFLIPFIQVILRADIRVTVMQIPAQDVITSDNVSVKVATVAYYRIVDAKMALLDVGDYRSAIEQLALVTLRSTIGMHSLDELLSQQDKLNETLAKELARRTAEWGVTISHVEIRSVDLDPSMVRAMAQQAEAERGARARIITAQGERDAADKLAEAADILGRNPAALTLRTLATLKEIGAEKNTTIVFPVAQDSLLPSAALTSAMTRAAVNSAEKAATTKP